MIEILNRYTAAVIYKSETAETVVNAVIEAVNAKANLRYANLSYADLREANLQSANLQYANLRSANLQYADLQYANLQSADLQYAKEIPPIAAAHTVVVPEGDLIGWKKCLNGVIVKLRVPSESRRSNATGRKCRAEFVDVVDVIGSDVGISKHDASTKYVAGTRVTCDLWCEDRWQECAGGIHFFITREEAEAY